MSPQDEKLEEALFGSNEPISDFADREPQTTVDGYDYAMLLLHFHDVVSMGAEPTGRYFYIAPGNNTTFTVQ